jgi:hypothetical protein
MGGERVFPIAWHVNYWDYLGWPDPLANPVFVDRQERYVDIFRTGMYTPELVVSAEEERASTTGSAVAAHIDAVMANPVTVSTTVWLDSAIDANPLVAGYAVDGAPAGTELMIVLVERGIVRDIEGGENAGLTLTHENAARTFATVTPGEGTVELEVPIDVVRENASLIAFVQDPATMALHGATDRHLTE